MFERPSISAATLPPLPDTIPDPTDAPAGAGDQHGPTAAANLANQPLRAFPFPFPTLRMLRHGCYLIRFTPSVSGFFTHYDGTLRVQRSGTNTTASGDLYLHNTFTWPPLPVVEPAVTRIPVFPRARYRYYLRVTQILEWITFGNSFTLGFNRYRFDAASNSWTDEGAFTAVMTWGSAPSGWAAGTDYLTGQVRDAGGATVGELTMGWVSPYLRRAVIEIDRVDDAEVPEASGYQDPDGTDIDWRYVFDEVDWNVTVVESDANLVEPSGESWSDAEMHQAMLAARDSSDLDAEWRYHLICVRLLDSTSRGIMYDAYGGDSNNVPREGAGLSSHWVIPDADEWGNVRGQRFGAAGAPYFRTAVHELGHAMGLYHNSADNGFMHTTPQIAASGTAANPFPDNVQWSFNADDAKRLRHMPDPWVRPGMIPFGQAYSTAPISPDDMAAEVDGLELMLTPLLETMPIGAPVRVDVEMVNHTGQPLPAPSSLSLKSGHVHGRVIDPAGNERVFWPLVQCVDEDIIEPLAADDAINDSMTLLRGPHGALFPMAGPYRIDVEAEWEIHGHPVRASASTRVMVTPAEDKEHAKAALAVLSCPDVLLAMVIGGDHLAEGVAAIQVALDNPVLRPHYAVIEAKRRAKTNRGAASSGEYIDESTVVSEVELKRWEAILDPSALDKASKEQRSKTDAILKQALERIRKDRAPTREKP